MPPKLWAYAKTTSTNNTQTRKVISELENPWQKLKHEMPYILPQDLAAINSFNKAQDEKTRKSGVAGKYDMFKIHPELLPEPFLGNPQANIFLLSLNPGYDPSDIIHYNTPKVADLCWQNMRHEATEYPFYLLNPDICKFGGYSWWTKKLRPLIQSFENHEEGQRIVAQNVCCVEFFPYHSQKYAFWQRIPSQEYSFHLVNEAINRKALIILMRAEKGWSEAVPKLKKYPKFYTLNSKQNVTISPANCPQGFPKIIELLK